MLVTIIYQVMIWLDNVNCSGDESDLMLCSMNSIGINNCKHDEDAVVICQCKSCNESFKCKSILLFD